MSNKTVNVKESIYSENDKIGNRVNDRLVQKGIFCVNVLGAPGSGKTSSLLQIIKRLSDVKPYVIEGDIESDIDTEKLKSIGIETVQINTGGACHLDSIVIEKTLDKINLETPGILFIENIGNLVCPAEFYIGEHVKLLVSSVAEGSDKPYKYPLAFEKADILLLNKADLKPYIDFDTEYYKKGVRALNPDAPIFEVSSKSEEGFDEVVQWLKARMQKKSLQFTCTEWCRVWGSDRLSPALRQSFRYPVMSRTKTAAFILKRWGRNSASSLF
jgi:hydrogenase nickel incorporation protein HypB